MYIIRVYISVNCCVFHAYYYGS